MAMQLLYEERVGRWAGADDAKKCSPSREMVGDAGFLAYWIYREGKPLRKSTTLNRAVKVSFALEEINIAVILWQKPTT